MSDSVGWTQLNTLKLHNSIAYEYVLGDEPLGKFRSVSELKSTYPEAVDDDDMDSEDSGKRVSLLTEMS